MREDEVTEFKKTLSELKEGVYSMAAMLNKQGTGTVYFGIRNDGEVLGVDIGKDSTRDVAREMSQNIKPKIIPNVSVIEIEGKHVIKVTADGYDIPYSAYDRYYMRIDDMDECMSAEMLGKVFEKKSMSMGEWERRSSGRGIECIDEGLVIRFMREGNNIGRISEIYRDVETSLTSLQLMCDDGTVNMAGYYLFSKDRPEKLKLAYFATDACVDFRDIREFNGNIIECIDAGVEYLNSKMDWRAEIDGVRRREIPEVPMEAIREIVTNSFCHRRYGSQPFNQIWLSPSSICIVNAGSLPADSDPEMFAKRLKAPIHRNPLIAGALYRCGRVEAYGSGFSRVFESCNRAHVEYRYRSDGDQFLFEFGRRGQITEVMNGELDLETLIMEEMAADPSITISKLAEMLGRSEAETYNAIRRMVDGGRVKREGSRKKGRWVVAGRIRLTGSNVRSAPLPRTSQSLRASLAPPSATHPSPSQGVGAFAPPMMRPPTNTV